MNLLDRYLEAVKKHLPWERQDDIVAELRANLESQLEDKEAELGRPFTTAEAEEWLKRMGSPIQVAGRYKRQQYLIGPAFFPTYWFVLRLVFFWATAVYLVVHAVLIVSGTPTWDDVAAAIFGIPWLLINTGAWVTIVFAWLEFWTARNPALRETMQARFGTLDSLPDIEDVLSARRVRSLAKEIAGTAVQFVMVVWLLLIPRHPFLLLGPGVSFVTTSPFVLTPVWVAFFWCAVILNVVQLCWRLFDLWTGRWRQAYPLQRVAFKIFGLIPAGILLSAQDHAYVALRNPAADGDQLGRTLLVINQSIFRGTLTVAAVLVVLLGWDLFSGSLNTYRRRFAAKMTP